MSLQPVTMVPAIFDAPNAANVGLFLQNQSGNSAGDNQTANWAPIPFGSGSGLTATFTSTATVTGTTSTTAVMGGLGALGTPAVITPAVSTRIRIEISGQFANATINDGATVDLRYGTGAAPANGAAVTGTVVGVPQTITSLVAAQRSGFTLQGIVTGLTVGTAYWVDLSQLAVTGGTTSVTGVNVSVYEF